MDVGNIALKLRDDDMRAGNNGVCVGDIVTDVRNDGLGVQSIAMDIGNDDLGGQNISMGVRSGHVCVYCKFGLGLGSQRRSSRSCGTHVKDIKDPVEVRPPGRDRAFIILRMEHPSDTTSLTLLDDVLLDLRHSSVIENLVSEYPGVRRRFNSRSQLPNRLED